MTRDETLKRLKGRALYADAVEALAKVVSNAHPAMVALLESQADFEKYLAAPRIACKDCGDMFTRDELYCGWDWKKADSEQICHTCHAEILTLSVNR